MHREIAPGVVQAEFWHKLDDGRIQCDLCPRYCQLHNGQRGFCFVREAKNDTMLLTSYGRTTGFCIDPIEKKPFNHFYPGSSVLSLGTVGCNLGCRFCQNWDMTKAREESLLSARATPQQVAERAAQYGCKSLAFTYNDPIIFAEYAVDCAQAAREHGVKSVVVSNGYMTEAARRGFYTHMDAANIDLKGFTEDFYHKLCFAHLAPILDTLLWLHRETSVWLEVTTLLIPGHNDSEAEVDQLCAWFVDKLGPDVPLHFSAFFPAYKMLDVAPTPPETVRRARKQALAAGIRNVYTGNIRDPEGQCTYCAGCGESVIGRDGYSIRHWKLDAQARCQRCGRQVAGHFDSTPGDWNAGRLPVVMG